MSVTLGWRCLDCAQNVAEADIAAHIVSEPHINTIRSKLVAAANRAVASVNVIGQSYQEATSALTDFEKSNGLEATAVDAVLVTIKPTPVKEPPILAEAAVEAEPPIRVRP